VSVPTGNVVHKEATKNPVERFLVDGFARAMQAALPLRASRILEVGCGEGRQLVAIGSRYPGADLVGLDLPDAQLEQAWRDVPAAQLVQGSALSLPFADKSFDLVMAVEVIEHLPDPEQALREIARVASDAVVISVPWEPAWRIGNVVRGRYVAALGNTPGHIQHFTRRGLLRFVGRHLDVETTLRPFPWTMIRAHVAS
jgi:SAM-dependent methyltransferase